MVRTVTGRRACVVVVWEGDLSPLPQLRFSRVRQRHCDKTLHSLTHTLRHSHTLSLPSRLLDKLKPVHPREAAAPPLPERTASRRPPRHYIHLVLVAGMRWRSPLIRANSTSWWGWWWSWWWWWWYFTKLHTTLARDRDVIFILLKTNGRSNR